jgi:hypothetical protein
MGARSFPSEESFSWRRRAADSVGQVTKELGKSRRAKTRRGPLAEKPFSLHWGSGIIEEEVQIATPYHLPTVQLLEFTAGPAAGRRAIRFCHYDTRGRFQRSPLIVDEEDIDTLARALTKSSKLRAMLAALTSRRRA